MTFRRSKLLFLTICGADFGDADSAAGAVYAALVSVFIAAFVIMLLLATLFNVLFATIDNLGGFLIY